MICKCKEIISKGDGYAVIVTDQYDVGFWARPGLWEDIIVGQEIDIEVPGGTSCTYPHPTIKSRKY